MSDLLMNCHSFHKTSRPTKANFPFVEHVKEHISFSVELRPRVSDGMIRRRFLVA
jgi:hypothetical protein